tara:strand:+ start:174 stop:287 length:114 start_codon:yes stop_codon:yes gene_type:complete
MKVDKSKDKKERKKKEEDHKTKPIKEDRKPFNDPIDW